MKFQNNPRDPETALYTALWHACAGPLPTLPGAGQLVFYFPQGHLQQVEASSNQVIDPPRFNLPSNILCRVIHVQLRADPDTDELLAQLTLLPQPIQAQNGAEMELPTPPSPEFRLLSFSKTLTPSDTSIHGGFSVPKRHAHQCFPPLDMSMQNPKQELVAKDLHGNEWRFQHVLKGQPRRHLLIGGWRDFVVSKRLVVGDAFVFLRGENEELRVGVRRAMRPNGNATSSESSSDPPDVLANAWEAYTRTTLFTIYYKPRRCPTDFIVPFDRFMESVNMNYSIGMRFESKEALELEQKFTGSIVGIEDSDPIRWMDSKWRCLKVKWDQNETSTAHLPERVSPWQIEPDYM
ncbi:ORESARA 14, ARF1-BINDING PROTEIN, auxin response factor 2, HLS1 SUPPRESSOR [Hibiscus trionum]|uniref:Auxin response factor n=1 Tax=Hibiscus trionum TaxID=183268 RepID=A0A9W7LL77_HIBTR|nr:ORESARA 14, ARF1-BINDING PROTEIN, auxin response factor 2, HLS1 SUPPRESSOR [Hibiscus trionum]